MDRGRLHGARWPDEDPNWDGPGTAHRREEQVAELVSRGLTNRAIAKALVVSERTAQNHVQHILTKLGFTTRSQIAAWVVSRRQTNR
jgi:DNA-binding NarL/FixJ family response regulator